MTNKRQELYLKWGTIKRYSFIDKEIIKLMDKFDSEGVSISIAVHKNTANQKQAILDIIDKMTDDDDIFNDFTDKRMTKKEAKEYILNYEKSVGSSEERDFIKNMTTKIIDSGYEITHSGELLS